MKLQPITPCLWFDNQAEEAAKFYVSVFPASTLGQITRYGKEGFEIHKRPEGSVMAAAFTINGQNFVALNGGPMFTLSEAISFQIFCDTQEEIDRYWELLTANGGQEGPCGWLKDQFGLSWQVVPSILSELMKDTAKAEKVTHAFMQMKKMDIEKLLNA